MKLSMILSFAVLFSATAFANQLDGRKFCRDAGRPFGAPPSVVAKHCVSFAKGVLTDNVTTFFGNPPTSYPYVLVDGKIVVNLNTHNSAGYTLSGNTLIMNTGPVLVEVK